MCMTVRVHVHVWLCYFTKAAEVHYLHHLAVILRKYNPVPVNVFSFY